MSKPYRPILNLDFDGVLHSYSSGWKGASMIPDPPVPGALEFILDADAAGWDVHIHSSRSHQWGGKRAMKRWLIHHYREMFWSRKDIQDAAGDEGKGSSHLVSTVQVTGAAQEVSTEPASIPRVKITLTRA